MSNNNPSKAEQVPNDAEEECWDLPADFNLYAKHEVGRVYYPAKRDCDDGDDTARNSFFIECIIPNTPLDINNKSQSDSVRYDATGHCVWAGAFLLIQCIPELREFDVGNKRLIELGCGTGIGGLAMMLVDDSSIVPASVCFTDNDPDALGVCERNCTLNNVSEESYSILELAWGEDADERKGGCFDVALATDVLYDVDLIEPLFTTVSRCIPSRGIFILSHIPRACYNEGNPPEAVEDLEKYIIGQAENYNLYLETIIRPPKEDEFAPEILDWCPWTSFAGGGIIVFRRA